MAGAGQQLIEHPRVGGRTVGADLGRWHAVLKQAGEEQVGCRQIPLLRHQNIDDLAELVDGAV